MNEEDWETLGSTWRAEPASPAFDTVDVDTLRARENAFSRTVFWRNAREAGVVMTLRATSVLMIDHRRRVDGGHGHLRGLDAVYRRRSTPRPASSSPTSARNSNARPTSSSAHGSGISRPSCRA